jgi:hypothetical protein
VLATCSPERDLPSGRSCQDLPLQGHEAARTCRSVVPAVYSVCPRAQRSSNVSGNIRHAICREGQP